RYFETLSKNAPGEDSGAGAGGVGLGAGGGVGGGGGGAAGRGGADAAVRAYCSHVIVGGSPKYGLMLLIGMAPFKFCASLIVKVLIAMTSPAMFRSGPPLEPW